MKITEYISNHHAFERAFIDSNRGTDFTPSGFEALFDYVEDCYGEDYELDVIELSCAYTEYDCLHDYYCSYSNSTHDECDEHIIAVTSTGTIVARAW